MLQPDWIPTDADVIQWYAPDERMTGAWIDDRIIVLEASITSSTRNDFNTVIPFVDAIVCVADLSCRGYPSFASPEKVSS